MPSRFLVAIWNSAHPHALPRYFLPHPHHPTPHLSIRIHPHDQSTRSSYPCTVFFFFSYISYQLHLVPQPHTYPLLPRPRAVSVQLHPLRIADIAQLDGRALESLERIGTECFGGAENIDDDTGQGGVEEGGVEV